MVEENIRKQLRKKLGAHGWALLLYSCVMNICVTGVCVIDTMIHSVLSGGTLNVQQYLAESVMNNAWGYVVSVSLGLVGMYLWKGKKFCRNEIWKSDRCMTVGSFFSLFCISTSAQAVFSILATVLETIFNLFDLSILESLEAATTTADTFSMFLYLAILAPVTEEIIFRGIILRSLEPYGKKFAILTSAFLFGIFHGNIVQSPFAFLAGLVFGYVAMEYNIGWAIVLHAINNLVLGDILSRISVWLPGWVSEVAIFTVIWGCTAAAIAILIVKRRNVADYFRSGKIHPVFLKCFFSSPGVVVLTGYMISNMLFAIILQAIS